MGFTFHDADVFATPAMVPFARKSLETHFHVS